MGPEEWEFVVGDHDIPAAVAGFTPDSLLAAMYSVLRQLRDGRHFLDNCYPEVVKPRGNRAAQRQLQQAMDVVDANWRGVGVIPASGFAIRERYRAQDARHQFPSYADEARKRAGLKRCYFDFEDMIQANADVLYLGETFVQIKERIIDRIREQGDITLAQVRDMFSTSRKYAVPFMEYCDSIGFTARDGNYRRLKNTTG